MDWEAEFKYLTATYTRPSVDDLYNSLRNRMDKEQAAALASLFLVVFDRIIGAETAPATMCPKSADARHMYIGCESGCHYCGRAAPPEVIAAFQRQHAP